MASNDVSHSSPHIIAIPFPVPGHINPLIHACQKLLAFGFRITYINTHEHHKSLFKTPEPITRDGIHFVGLPDTVSPLEEGAHHPTGMDGVKIILRSSDGLQPATEEFIDSILASGDEVRCIISDSFLPWVQDIASKHGLPRVAFNTTTATFDLVCLHMKRFKSEGFMPVNTRTTGDKMIEFIPGMPSFSPLDIPLAFYDEHPIIDFIIRAYDRVLEADWILASTFEKLEADILAVLRDHFGARNYLPIGPFLPDSHVFPTSDKTSDRAGLDPEGIKSLEWLDSQSDSSVLYVAFGSIAVLTTEQFLELMEALEGSEQVILWAVRPSLVRDLPREKFEGFVERTKRRIHVIRSWAPQLHILRHATVGGFLSHCGWNSTSESLCAGVPMIGWPCLSEQNLNCSFLVKHKLAIGLRKPDGGLIQKQEIIKAARDLMTGESGAEMRKNVGGGQESIEGGWNIILESGSFRKSNSETLRPRSDSALVLCQIARAFLSSFGPLERKKSFDAQSVHGVQRVSHV